MFESEQPVPAKLTLSTSVMNRVWVVPGESVTLLKERLGVILCLLGGGLLTITDKGSSYHTHTHVRMNAHTEGYKICHKNSIKIAYKYVADCG